MSSHDIAREAVEDEFKRRRRRGPASVDSSDEDKPAKRGKRPRHQKLREVPKEHSSEEDEAPKFEYRDRAKERREGHAPRVDPSDEENQNSDALEDALEAALGRKSEKLNADRTIKEQSNPGIKLPTTRKQAIQLLQHPLDSTNSQAQALWSYLQSTLSVPPVEESPAGRAIRRSTLQFSIQCCTGDGTTWHLPTEQTYGEDLTESFPVLPEDLVDGDRNALKQNTVVKSRPCGKAVETANEEDSDEDIFGNVGDYDPSNASPSGNFSPAFKASLMRFPDVKSARNSQSTEVKPLAPPQRLSGLEETDYGPDMDFEVEENDSEEKQNSKKKIVKKSVKKLSSVEEQQTAGANRI